VKLAATIQYRCADMKATEKRQISVMALQSFCTEDAACKNPSDSGGRIVYRSSNRSQAATARRKK
jgi:hypothetical protein